MGIPPLHSTRGCRWSNGGYRCFFRRLLSPDLGVMQHCRSANTGPHSGTTYRHRCPDARIASHLPTLVDANADPYRPHPCTDASRDSARA